MLTRAFALSAVCLSYLTTRPPPTSRCTPPRPAHVAASTLDPLGGRIVLHFLPPYCPDANRIERVWQDFHANVTRNHRCKTMNQLLDNARHYVDAYVWRRTIAEKAARAATLALWTVIDAESWAGRRTPLGKLEPSVGGSPVEGSRTSHEILACAASHS